MRTVETINNKLSSEREESLKNLYEMRAEAEKRGFLSDEEIEFEIQEAKRRIKYINFNVNVIFVV